MALVFSRSRGTSDSWVSHLPRAFVLPRDLPQIRPDARRFWTWFSPSIPGWRLLLAGSLIAIATATYEVVSTPTRFMAETLVAMAPVATDVQFEPSISSSVDPYANGRLSGAEHRQALADLVSSTAIEDKVRAQLGTQLSTADRMPGALVARVHAALLPRSEIIAIQVEAEYPSDAVIIANSWAKTYVDDVSRIYGPADSLQALQSARDDAQSRSQQAQAALIENLQHGKLEQVAAQMTRDQQQIDLWITPSASSDYRMMQWSAINDLADRLRRFETARLAAQVLANDVNNNAGFTDQASVELLAAQVVSLGDQSSLKDSLQLQFRITSLASPATDLTNIIRNIETSESDLQRRLDRESATFASVRSEEIQRLEAELRGLRSEYQAQLAERTLLTSHRDITIQSYDALARKAAERQVTATSLQRQVEIASPSVEAVSAPKPLGRQLMVSALVGCALVVAGMILKRFVRLDRPGLTPAPAVSAQ